MKEALELHLIASSGVCLASFRVCPFPLQAKKALELHLIVSSQKFGKFQSLSVPYAGEEGTGAVRAAAAAHGGGGGGAQRVGQNHPVASAAAGHDQDWQAGQGVRHEPQGHAQAAGACICGPLYVWPVYMWSCVGPVCLWSCVCVACVYVVLCWSCVFVVLCI